MAEKENGMDWLPKPIQNIAIKSLFKLFKQKGVQSLILQFDNNIDEKDKEKMAEAFTATFYSDNVKTVLQTEQKKSEELLKLIDDLREQNKKLNSRNEFLEKFRNKALSV